MIKGILNYFSSLNTAGQALFVVGVLLIITFINCIKTRKK